MIASTRLSKGGIFFAVRENECKDIHCFNQFATECIFDLHGSLNPMIHTIQCDAGKSYLLNADEMKWLMWLQITKLRYSQGFVMCENCGFGTNISCDYIRDRRIDIFVRLLENMEVVIKDNKIIGCRACPPILTI